MPFLLNVGGLDLGKEFDLIEEGVLGSIGNPKSSTIFQSDDFDLLCFIKSPVSGCLEPDSARGRISSESASTVITHGFLYKYFVFTLDLL